MKMLTVALLSAIAGPAWAQSHAHAHTDAAPAAAPAAVDHSKMDHSKMDHSNMDHSTMDQSTMDHGGVDHPQMDHSTMDHAAMGHGTAPVAPREPIPEVTDADRAAAFPPINHDAMEHAPNVHSLLLINRLEHWDGQHGTGQATSTACGYAAKANAAAGARSRPISKCCTGAACHRGGTCWWA